MSIIKVLVLICQLVVFTKTKTYVIIEEKIENCAKEEEDMFLYDYTNFELIPENDTHTFLNGSIVVKKTIESPWFIHSHTEHYERGKWLMQAYNNDCLDFCKEIHNPTKPWYYITKNIKGCPIPSGYTMVFNMVPIEFSRSLVALLPSHYMGRWRLIIDGKFNVNGKILHECKVGFGDIYIE